MTTFLFALRLAWRQLIFEKGKLIAAVLGITFACVLIFMQLGFRDALFSSVAEMPNRINGDLFIQHQQSEALWRGVSFPRSEMMRAYAIPEVAQVVPLYIMQAQWRSPHDFKKRTLLLYGIQPEERVLRVDGIVPFEAALKQKDTVIFDRLSKPTFGPIEDLLKKGPLEVEVNDYRMRVIGTYLLGTSFSSDGSAITSDQNFMRIAPNRSLDQVDVGVVRLKPHSDINEVKQKLRAALNDTVYVFDKNELIEYELNYWREMAPVGFIFGLGAIMGLIVGMVIVYQILYTDIINHLSELATLRAMGYTYFYLVKLVFSSSLILAVLGFIPGLLISAWLYHLSESVLFIAFPMPLEKIIMVFMMTLGMCIFAGILAMRKLRSASPAEMFQ